MTVHPRNLLNENVELRHKLDSLLAELEMRGEPLPCRMTPSEEIVARALRSRSPNLVTREMLFAALYAFRSESDEPEIRTVDVILSHTRKRLAAVDIRIENEWGRGWRLNDSGATRWDKLSKGQNDR